MTNRTEETVIDIVWNNSSDKRYVPRAYGPHTVGWGIWDAKEDKYIEGEAVAAIDPHELRRPTKH